MSRIGRKPVVVPAGVEVAVDANNVVTVKGPKGQLSQQISKKITVEVADGAVNVTRGSDQREERAQHGLARTLINNMVIGVTNGFEKKMQLVGVGYRADVYKRQGRSTWKQRRTGTRSVRCKRSGRQIGTEGRRNQQWQK